MAHYRRYGDIPAKRHTQHRRPDFQALFEAIEREQEKRGNL